jgi:hypothetical protein
MVTLHRCQLQQIFWKYPGIADKIQWPPAIVPIEVTDPNQTNIVGDEFMTSKEVVYPSCECNVLNTLANYSN